MAVRATSGGDDAPIRWAAVGSDWKTGDTVRIKASWDDGVTWAIIAGAGNVSYHAGLFNWNTTGIMGSSLCRVRVTRNGQPPVTTSSTLLTIVAAGSVRDCKMKADTSLVAVSGKRVSAVFDDCFYVQEDRSCGIGIRRWMREARGGRYGDCDWTNDHR